MQFKPVNTSKIFYYNSSFFYLYTRLKYLNISIGFVEGPNLPAKGSNQPIKSNSKEITI